MSSRASGQADGSLAHVLSRGRPCPLERADKQTVRLPMSSREDGNVLSSERTSGRFACPCPLERTAMSSRASRQADGSLAHVLSRGRPCPLERADKRTVRLPMSSREDGHVLSSERTSGRF